MVEKKIPWPNNQGTHHTNLDIQLKKFSEEPTPNYTFNYYYSKTLRWPTDADEEHNDQSIENEPTLNPIISYIAEQIKSEIHIRL